jgi:putative ABC transport system permease protein
MQFYQDVEREIMSRPGVRGVAWASTLPMGPSYAGQSFFEIAGDPSMNESARPSADYQIVSPAYFETLDLPVVAGRAFTERDTAESAHVCMVNEAFARRYLAGRSAIGLRLALWPADAPQQKPVVREIVGVARQVKGRPDETEDLMQVYVPMAQDLMDDTFLVVRPDSPGVHGFAASVRSAIARVDKEQLVSIRSVMTLEDIAREATARHRFRAVLVMTFAGLALALAMIGVFGILAYSVQQRMRDFGVRRVLGATSADILGMVLANALRVIAAGAFVGLLLSAGLGRLLTAVLFGVQPLDPLTFASVAIVLAVTTAASVAGPAWRATRIEPAAALRSE